MAITHTWKIQHAMQQNDGTGTVSVVFYRVSSQEDDVFAQVGNFVQLNTENIENFIPYANLTEETMIQWVKDSIGEQEVLRIESNNQESINNQKNPPTPRLITEPLPWA